MSPLPASLRPALAPDIPAILAIAAESATAAHWSVADYEKALAASHPRRLVLVAELNRTIVGFLVAKQVQYEWELENIAIQSSVRRTGIATSLLARLIDSVRSQNGTSIFLEVRASNSPARNLYQRAGWLLTGKRIRYYTHPEEDAAIYSLTVQ